MLSCERLSQMKQDVLRCWRPTEERVLVQREVLDRLKPRDDQVEVVSDLRARENTSKSDARKESAARGWSNEHEGESLDESNEVASSELSLRETIKP